MDKFPVIWKGKSVGELVLEPEKLYTWFAVRCCVPEGLWCAWVVGKNGELRLGVLEPAAGEFVIRRRYSEQMASPALRARSPGVWWTWAAFSPKATMAQPGLSAPSSLKRAES